MEYGIDIQGRYKKYIMDLSIAHLPASEKQLSTLLSLIDFVKERQDTAVIINMCDKEQADNVPQRTMISSSADKIYMELEYPMNEWDWDHPLLLADSELMEDEAASVITSIFSECTDDNPIVFNCFRDITSYVYPDSEGRDNR